MSGRFSVNNLFSKIAQTVTDAVKQAVQNIFNAIKEYGVTALKILVLLKQFYDSFRNEIRSLARFIQRLPDTVIKNVGRLTDRLGNQIRKLPDDFQKRLFKFGRDIDSGFRRIISPFQKEVNRNIQNASNNIVKFQRGLNETGKTVNRVANDVKNAPQNVSKQVTKTIGNEIPSLVRKSQTAVIELIDTATKKVPLLKSATKTLSQVDEVLKPLAKNASSIGKIVIKAPGLFDDLAKILKGVFVGGKGVIRALPFLGGLIEALEWEYFKREFRELFKQVDRVFPRIDELYQQNLKERQTQLRQQAQIDRIEKAVTQLGSTRSGNANLGNSSLSQSDISAIANAVSRAVNTGRNANNDVSPNAIANAVVNALGKPTPVDYGRIEGLINKGVSTIKIPQTQQQQGNADVLLAINGLKPLFPDMKSVVTQINSNTNNAVKNSQSNSFSDVLTQYGETNRLLQTINSSVVNNTTTINQIKNTTNTTGVTLQQLTLAENRITTEVRNAGRTQQQNTNVADKGDVSNLLREIQRIDFRGNITVNPTPVTVNPTPVNLITQQVTPVDYSRINTHTTQTIRDEVSKIPRPQPDPAAQVAATYAQRTFNLVGGTALENGLNLNFENEIKGQGVKQYQNMPNLVNTLPLAMAAFAAPLFMRGGLHRLPSQIASNVNDPNATPTTINDAVGLQRHYHSLIDQRFGSPVDVKVRNPDGSFTTSRARNVNEGLDTLTSQNIALSEEIAILQQTCTKLAAETLKVANIVYNDHHILESIRDFCGYRYTESKTSTPSEMSLGKENLLDWMKQGSLHGIAQKFDGKMDLTEMLQKIYLEVGKVSASTFSRFDAANPNAKLPIENTSPQSKTDDDDEWLRFVKLVNETPAALKDDADIKAVIKRYTNNATSTINVSAVQLPQG